MFVGFVLFVSLTYSILLLGYSWIVEDNIFNRIVSEEAKFIQETYQKRQTITEPRAPFLTLYESWSQLPLNIYQQHLKKPEQVEFKTLSGNSFYAKPIRLGQTEAVLMADISQYEVGEDYLPMISSALFLLLLVISGVASLLAYWVARNIMKPLKILAHKVQKSEHVKEGFASEFPHNEIGILANSIESGFLKIQSLLIREENFTRDVSHELRTPVTVIKNLVTALKESPKSSVDITNNQLRYLDDSIEQIEQTIVTLLALAREESAHLESLKLIHLVESCVVKHFELSHRDDFIVDIKIADDFEVIANHTLLVLLINNLLSNALQYASNNHLLIQAENSTIIFKNETSFAHQQDPFNQQVKRISSVGLGQGLYLVKRVCQVFNWEVESMVKSDKFSIIMKIE